ncbi:MAG TPA: TRAP transporter large permease [Alphaproteobacteria bacterium]|nr:TRAP transporter large permease [Alphaproteobacteria bacterium]
MDPLLIVVVGLAVMFVLILLHVPVGVAMLAVGIVGYAMMEGWRPALSSAISEIAGNIENPGLAVIPLFLLMGSFATAGGLSAEIYRFANALVGHRKGGLAMATMAGCGIFGAVCGSSTATAATFGKVALPEMLKRGYAPHFAAGTIAAGGTLGALVPPSVIMIIYAVVTQVNILDLFVAAVVPAALAIIFHFIAIRIYLAMRPEVGPAGARSNWRERLRATIAAWAVLLLLIAVLGGIYGGVVTVEEAAALGAVLSLVFAIVRRRLTWTAFWTALIESAAATAMIYVIIFGASVFAYFVTIAGVPPMLKAWIGGLPLPPILIIFVLLGIYIVLGAIFDTVSAMLITLPFVLPIVTQLGYDPIWWGIINVVVVELGMITPPIGMNVFVLHSLAPRISLSSIFAGVMPFVVSDIVRLTVLTLFPILTLYLVTG